MLIMCSSDARPKYVSDIAMALAMPTGTQFRFRYHRSYLSKKVHQKLGDGSLVEEDALICFHGNRGSGDEEFLVPIRLAKVCAVEEMGDAYVFTLQAADYPDLGQWAREFDGIRRHGVKELRRMVSDNDSKYYAVSWDSSRLLVSNVIVGKDGWVGVVDRLLRLPTFKNSYLLRLDLTDDSGVPVQIDVEEGGWLKFDPRRSYRVRVWFKGDNTYFGNRTIRLLTNGEVLSSISDQVYDVRSRYDQVDFWFTPKVGEQPKRTLLRLISSPSGEPDEADIGTEVELLCLVTRPLGPRMWLALLSGISATVVSAPALMGDGVPFVARLLVGSLGALGIAFAAGLR